MDLVLSGVLGGGLSGAKLEAWDGWIEGGEGQVHVYLFIGVCLYGGVCVYYCRTFYKAGVAKKRTFFFQRDFTCGPKPFFFLGCANGIFHPE